MTPLALALAALVGLSLGLRGGGGAILTVPIFVYVLGFAARDAVASSLAVVGAVSLVGVAGHWRQGNVEPRTALAFGLVAMTGTFAGARLGARLPGAVQLTLFAGVMLAAAGFMSRPRPSVPSPGKEEEGRMAPGLVAAAGFGVGVLTGLVGVGGGFMIVPALVLLGGMTMRHAVGTSLLVIAMNSAAGVAGYWGQAAVRWDVLGAFTAIAAAGIVAGTRLSRRVPQEALRRSFAAFLVLVAGFILWQSRGAFIH